MLVQPAISVPSRCRRIDTDIATAKLQSVQHEITQSPLQPVRIPFSALLERTPGGTAAIIEQAFGRESLGLLLVEDVPGYAPLRQNLLPLASQVQALPAKVKRSLECPKTHCSIGYSIGREALEDGQPDVHKASYYANPIEEQPSGCTRRNVWPSESLPELQPAFQDLGLLIVHTGQLLALHLDRYVEAQGLRPRRRLADIIQHSPSHKGRLLHYLPSQPGHNSQQRWCGQHTDFCSLTGLTSAMFLRGSEPVPCPDSEAGLWVSNRAGSFQQVLIPPDALAFQLGQAGQVLSGGLLQATPHYVQAARGPASHGIARNAFAVFMQPRWDQVMDAPAGADTKYVGIGQWTPGITFGDFAQRTMKTVCPGEP